MYCIGFVEGWSIRIFWFGIVWFVVMVLVVVVVVVKGCSGIGFCFWLVC